MSFEKSKCVLIIGAAALWSPSVGGCAHSPETRAQKSGAIDQANVTLNAMRAESPDLRDLLDRAYGYAVLPDIGKGGFIVGGAHGTGVVYQNHKPIGFVELSQASLGAQLGAQTFSEIVVFQTSAGLERLKSGRLSLGASASAVILKSGAGAGIEFKNGVAVVIKPKGGAMVDVSVSGQKLKFQPRG